MTTPSVKYATWHEYAGIVVRANPSLPVLDPPDVSKHMDRAVWLTSQLEAAGWGTVQSYDGVAMSGGLLHNICIDRAGNQATLFQLIRAVEDSCGPKGAFERLKALYEALYAKGWKVTQDGRLRTGDGALVPAAAIQAEFTGPHGLTPPSGPQFENAKRWALLFHGVLADPRSYGVQFAYAAKWLAQGNAGNELLVYRRFSGMAQLDSPIGLPADKLPPEIDLAMSVYHCFSTNAPGIASKVLERVWKMPNSTDAAKFAAALIKGLGTADFGKWHDEPGDGPNRYDRTRKAVARRQDFWPAALSGPLMPVDLA